MTIEPDENKNSVVISGKNGAGKSTAIDMIWLALTIKAKKKDVPKAENIGGIFCRRELYRHPIKKESSTIGAKIPPISSSHIK